MGKKRRRGHYCYLCGRTRANEKFSGKGHRQHICKDCQKLKKQGIKSDENFAYIEDYTEGGFPFGITHEEWNELDQFERAPYNEHVYITLPPEMADKLKHISSEKSLENAIYYSITLSLYIADEISMERAAYLLDYNFTDLIYFLQSKRIYWSVEEKDGHKQYEQSINDLLLLIDQLQANMELAEWD